MNVFLFVISVLVMSFQAFALFPACILYFIKKERLHLLAAIILLCLLLEQIALEYYDFSGPEKIYLFFLQLSLPRIILSCLVLITEFYAILFIFDQKFNFLYLLVFLPYLIFEYFAVIHSNQEIFLWLYYSARQIYRLLLLSLYSYLFLKGRKKKVSNRLSKFHYFLLPFFLLNFTIMIEDTLTISHIQLFFSASAPLRGKNFSELILWLTFDAAYLTEVWPLFKRAFTQPQKEDLNFDIQAFSNQYHLTPRESEIILQLLQNLTPAESAEALFISLGTFKTHMHNIYVKTGTSNRIELQRLISEF